MSQRAEASIRYAREATRASDSLPELDAEATGQERASAYANLAAAQHEVNKHVIDAVEAIHLAVVDHHKTLDAKLDTIRGLLEALQPKPVDPPKPAEAGAP